jgi:hypothetical protein
MPVTNVNAGGVNANEYVVFADLRQIDLCQPQHVGGVLAVLVLHDGPHRHVWRHWTVDSSAVFETS